MKLKAAIGGTRLTWADLDPEWLRALIERARAEDMGGAGLVDRVEGLIDVTTLLLPEKARGSAVLTARHRMVVAGLPLVPMILEVYGGAVSFTRQSKDGAVVESGTVLGRFEGTVRQLLEAERVILNFLQKLSGVATETAVYVKALGDSETRLLDTRKTTPGYRMLEKYAVACGGGWNHRLGLYDRVMLKDNHLAVSGLIGERLEDLVRRAKVMNPAMLVEVEVDRMGQIEPVLDAGADIVLLDNFSLAALGEAVALIGDRAATEASGGITVESIPALRHLGLDFISTGATIHQSRWVDIGLDWEA